jgi:hypothetical protein
MINRTTDVEEKLRKIVYESVKSAYEHRRSIREILIENVSVQGWKVTEEGYFWRKAKREAWAFTIETESGKYTIEVTCPRSRSLPLDWFLNEVEISIAKR